MKSIIYASDKVKNKERRFGADPEYYAATVVLLDGQRMPALFTQEAIQLGIDRARYNAEDMPPASLLQRIRALFR